MDKFATRIALSFAAIGKSVLRLMLKPQMAPIVVPTKE